MNLLQIRTKLRSESGRYDLVNADYSDNGADFYINEGIKYLDQLADFSKEVGRFMTSITAGTVLVTFENCRSIKAVNVVNSEKQWELTKKDLREMWQKYGTLWDDVDQATAQYYTPAFLRPIQSSNDESLTDEEVTNLGYTLSHIDFKTTDNETYNGVLILPPTKETLLVEVWGLFYSKYLSQDTDQNFWTAVHPDLVIMAAMMKIEAMNRNTQGFNDWKNSIQTFVNEITNDWVEQESETHDQISG